MPLPLLAIGIGMAVGAIAGAIEEYNSTGNPQALQAAKRARAQAVLDGLNAGMTRAQAEEHVDESIRQAITDNSREVSYGNIAANAALGGITGGVGEVAGAFALKQGAKALGKMGWSKAAAQAAKQPVAAAANPAARRTVQGNMGPELTGWASEWSPGMVTKAPMNPPTTVFPKYSAGPDAAMDEGERILAEMGRPPLMGRTSALPTESPTMQVSMAQNIAGNAMRNASMVDASGMLGQLTPKEIAFRMRLNQRFMDQKGRLLPPSDVPGWPGRVASWADINGT